MVQQQGSACRVDRYKNPEARQRWGNSCAQLCSLLGRSQGEMFVGMPASAEGQQSQACPPASAALPQLSPG